MCVWGGLYSKVTHLYEGWVMVHCLPLVVVLVLMKPMVFLLSVVVHVSPSFVWSVGGNGPASAPPSSGAPSGSMSLPGNVPSGSPYTIPPEPTLSQNPLSIMMSRMSKFAMPSSTPLYHDAIKTVASSDDDSPPARSPNLPSVNNNGNLAYTCPFVVQSVGYVALDVPVVMFFQMLVTKTSPL